MKRTPLFATLVLLFSLVTGFAYAQDAAININTADVATLASLNGVRRRVLAVRTRAVWLFLCAD